MTITTPFSREPHQLAMVELASLQTEYYLAGNKLKFHRLSKAYDSKTILHSLIARMKLDILHITT